MSDILHYLVSIPKHLLKPSDSDKGPSNFRTVRVQVYKLAGEIMKEHNVLHWGGAHAFFHAAMKNLKSGKIQELSYKRVMNSKKIRRKPDI